jgi:LacI family transcriptional regulator
MAVSDKTSRHVTVKDVAEAANVALSSASRVLTDHPNVSEGMRQRVLAAAERLGYEPDLVARTLRTGNSRTLGFLVADLDNPISSSFIRGAEDSARARGYGLLLTNSEGDPAHDAENLQLFLRRRVDAIILLTSDSGSEVEGVLESSTVPAVVLDRDLPSGSSASSVFFDHANGMHEATGHLLERGHRQVAFVGGPEELRPVSDRLAGYVRAFQDHDLLVDRSLISTGSLRPAFGRTEARRLLESDTPPTALIVGGNQLLNGVLEAIHDLDLRVGEDLALVSCDDVDLTRLYQPSISSVVRDVYKSGQIAAELAIEQLTEDDVPVRTVLLPTWFVARDSTAVMPTARL